MIAKALLMGIMIAAAHPANQVLPYGEINWDRGYVRISAVGLPPFGGAGPAKARENAVSAAQKRLLGVLLDLDTPKGDKLRDHVARRPELRERLRHLVYAAGVQGKSYSDGAVEVTLTLALEGPNGLQALLDAL